MKKAPIFVLKIGLEPNENPRAVPASRYGAWVQSVKEHSVKLSRNGKIYATVEKTSKTAEKVRAVPAPCC